MNLDQGLLIAPGYGYLLPIVIGYLSEEIYKPGLKCLNIPPIKLTKTNKKDNKSIYLLYK